jgi:hypothetical protein
VPFRKLFANFNYVYGIELLVVLAVVLVTAYVLYALGVFTKGKKR